MATADTHKLSDVLIRRLKPREKPYKVTDGKGLYIYVPTTGDKVWRYNYTFHGLQKTLTIGHYPEVGLFKAREETVEAKKALRAGIDPMTKKKAAKDAARDENIKNSFQNLALEYLENQREGKSEEYITTTLGRAKIYLFPYLGHRPINEIETPEIFAVLKRIEKRKLYDTANQMRSLASQVFAYAMSTGRTRDSGSGDRKQ
jgi:hypothetical protein